MPGWCWVCAADHAFIGSDLERSGYMNRLQVDQNYNVVTAACLLIRKSVYEQVGGLDKIYRLLQRCRFVPESPRSRVSDGLDTACDGDARRQRQSE